MKINIKKLFKVQDSPSMHIKKIIRISASANKQQPWRAQAGLHWMYKKLNNIHIVCICDWITFNYIFKMIRLCLSPANVSINSIVYWSPLNKLIPLKSSSRTWHRTLDSWKSWVSQDNTLSLPPPTKPLKAWAVMCWRGFRATRRSSKVNQTFILSGLSHFFSALRQGLLKAL